VIRLKTWKFVLFGYILMSLAIIATGLAVFVFRLNATASLAVCVGVAAFISIVLVLADISSNDRR
jgi:purine-cytosine permease-like protein